MRSTMIWPAVVACCLTVSLAHAQRADRAKEADRQPDRAAQDQRDIPRNVQDSVHRWYPDAKLQLMRSYQVNGVNVYQVRVDAKNGQTRARVTEFGDIVTMGFPDVGVKNLPGPVATLNQNMFKKEPAWADKIQTSSYLVQTDFGKTGYQIEVNPVGQVTEVRRLDEVRDEDISKYPRATRQEEEALTPRLNQYFKNPQVKAVHRYPEAENFFWVQLSTPTEPDVRILMNPEREVVKYRVQMDQKQTPRPVQAAIQDMFQNARVRQTYRVEQVYYRFAQPTRGDEYTLINATPLGEIDRVRTVGASWLGLGGGRDQDQTQDEDRDAERPVAPGRSQGRQ